MYVNAAIIKAAFFIEQLNISDGSWSYFHLITFIGPGIPVQVRYMISAPIDAQFHITYKVKKRIIVSESFYPKNFLKEKNKGGRI